MSDRRRRSAKLEGRGGRRASAFGALPGVAALVVGAAGVVLSQAGGAIARQPSPAPSRTIGARSVPEVRTSTTPSYVPA